MIFAAIADWADAGEFPGIAADHAAAGPLDGDGERHVRSLRTGLDELAPHAPGDAGNRNSDHGLAASIWHPAAGPDSR